MASMPSRFHLENRDDENAGGIRPGIPYLRMPAKIEIDFTRFTRDTLGWCRQLFVELQTRNKKSPCHDE